MFCNSKWHSVAMLERRAPFASFELGSLERARDFATRKCSRSTTLAARLLTFADKRCLSRPQVHWFPRHISELDLIANRTLDAGTDLEADHPGFHDSEYRERRARLAAQALNFRMHHEIPRTEYTAEEVETWGLVWDTMEGLWDEVRERLPGWKA